MSFARTIVVAGCSALLAVSVAAAQRRAVPVLGSEEEQVGVAIAVQVAGQPFQSTGKATCTHEPKGYIWGTPAQQWSVEYDEGQHSLHLTLWRPAGGAPDMFSLGASIGAKSHTVTTSKGRDGGSVQGSGRVTLAPGSSGGTFTIDATTASGSRISGNIKCAAFTSALAEGGE